MKRKFSVTGLSLLLFAFVAVAVTSVSSAQAQTFAHERSKSYMQPTDPAVLEKLEEWKDIKFGMLIHWGLYSQMGIVESWSICSEEADWIPRDSTIPYDQYKREYWDNINKFNPTKFDPAKWAEIGQSAGMKYVIFTTKHHDGFNMYDTKYSDFSIANGPFAKDPRMNIAKEVFSAFRDKGYMIGAYYSKPDWHSQYYWWDRYATPTRGVNYRIDKNEWRWRQFNEFVCNQLDELTNGDYGRIDILWLDGGWVRSLKTGEPMDSAIVNRQQKIDMPRIAANAHKHQPGMIVVERSVPGEFENYQTPERGIPDAQMDVPWESCITLGHDWGYVPGDEYKSPAKVIHTLAEIVAKGGNYLLGIGPKADGTIPDEVTWRLEAVGKWLGKNGEAIYGTRITPIYNDDKTWFTSNKDGSKIYAIVCLDEESAVPGKVIWKGNEPVKGSKMILLESGKPVNWKKTKNGIEVSVPKSIKQREALAFSFEPAK